LKSSKLKVKEFRKGKDNAEAQRTQRLAEEENGEEGRKHRDPR